MIISCVPASLSLRNLENFRRLTAGGRDMKDTLDNDQTISN